MNEQDDFFENGLVEILSTANTTPSTRTNEPEAASPCMQEKKSAFFPYTNVIVRLSAALIAITLLISFSANIFSR